MAHLEVLVPHQVNILPDGGEQLDFASSVERLGLPRADEHPEEMGTVTIYGEVAQTFDLVEITYGNVTNLPPYDPDAYYVVSKPTIAAALRDPRLDKSFTEKLLFPYDPVRDPVTNEFLGVRGLARAIPVKRYKPDGIGVPPLTSFEIDAENLRNTCPYPFKLYAKDTAPYVDDEHPTAISWAAAAPEKALSVRYAEAELNTRLTDMLGGVPIYETEVTGVHNDDTDTDEAWRLCHIDVPPALRSVAGALTMLDLVRLDGKKTVMGGKALARLAPHHYDEPII